MKRNIYISIIIFALISVCWANLSSTSAQLEKLRLRAESTQNKSDELAYLRAFPKNYDAFKLTFYGKNLDALDELYDKHMEHLNLLDRLSKKYPNRVLSIWLSVAINGKWEADAIGILQHQLINYAAAHTKHFAESILKKSQNQQLSIIKFLADVENHYSYNSYQETQTNLENLGYKELSEQFRKAKQVREKQPH